MADRKGEDTKRIEGCTPQTQDRCPNLQSRETWDCETCWCDVCGEFYTLYDEDMK
jgi:hypothetical protein